jgi:hypothetical protein
LDKELKVAICGDVCSECPRYIATMTNDTAEFAKVARLWQKAGYTDRIVSAEEIKCHGCNRTMKCSNEVNTCEFLGNKSTCGECDFFPCDKINKVFNKSEIFKEICRKKCTEEEFQQLNKAFFKKKEILTKINSGFKGKR